MSRYLVTEPAENDLDDILFYIAADNQAAALSLYERFLRGFENLAQMPNIGRLRNDLADGLRSFPEGGYLIFYRQIDADTIEIIRVLHGARDIPNEFIM